MQTENDYRTVLRDALARRCQANPSYNMSRFARDLGLSPGRLSEIFSRRQGLSIEVGKRIGGILGLSEGETEFFCDQIEFEHGRSQAKRELARLRLLKRSEELDKLALEVDTFQVISDWYHFAIVQLIEIPIFREDPKWIGKALNISAAEAASAVDRLLRVGILYRDDKGALNRVDETIVVHNKVSSEAVRKFHEQVMDKAKMVLSTRPLAERTISSGMVCIRRSDFEEIRAKVRRFSSRLLKEAEASPKDKEAVYCLSMQFFELTDAAAFRENGAN
jgi:uncharacterized protein (TIGR02147 family)